MRDRTTSGEYLDLFHIDKRPSWMLLVPILADRDELNG